MTSPTDLDRENAARRNAIALRFRNEYLEALGYATSLFGPGWEPHGKHALVTHEEAARVRNSSERAVPHAVVFTARKGREERHFMVEHGMARECGPYQEALKDMLDEPHPTRTFTHKGQVVPIHRFEIHWSGFEPNYRPASAEQLAAARAKREAKAERRWQEQVDREARSSLFPDLVRERAEERRKGTGRA